jgi:hypothetical protein
MKDKHHYFKNLNLSLIKQQIEMPLEIDEKALLLLGNLLYHLYKKKYDNLREEL